MRVGLWKRGSQTGCYSFSSHATHSNCVHFSFNCSLCSLLFVLLCLFSVVFMSSISCFSYALLIFLLVEEYEIIYPHKTALAPSHNVIGSISSVSFISIIF